MNKVMELRNSMHMSQEAFAEFCDVSRASIARYEAGAPLSRLNAQKIARACHISIDVLLQIQNGLGAEPIPAREPSSFQLSEEEKAFVMDYRLLNSRGKKRAAETLQELKVVYSKSKNN